MKRLRIAIWHNLPSGGGKRQLHMHVQGLLQRGHYLESWRPDAGDHNYLPLGEIITEHVVPLKGELPQFQNTFRSSRITKRLLQNMEDHCRRCADAILSGQFDVLFAGACAYFRTSPIAGFVGLPTAIYLGEPFRWFYEAMPELPWIAPPPLVRTPRTLRSLRNAFAKRAALNGIRLQARAELEYLKRFDLVLANSVFSRETILRTYNIESRVCRLGVDADYYKPTGEAKEAFVVGLGTLYHGKGVDRAIRAIGEIPASHRPALVWIGNGAWAEDLEGYRRLSRQCRVDFIPRLNIPDAEVISLLSRARAMVYTSRLEPFGLAPLEANACGTPVVGIAEGGIKESIVDGVNGFLAQDDNPKRLGELIERFVNDPELAIRMGQQAREHVCVNWSLNAATDNIEAALSKLIADKPAKSRLGDSRQLLKLSPTNNVRCHIEQSTIQGGALRVKGWAHINDGRPATGADIFILVRSASEAQIIRADKMPRTDITQHFGGEIDYDDSGFLAEGRTTVRAPYSTAVVIVRAGETALHPL